MSTHTLERPTLMPRDVDIRALEVHPRNLEIYGEPDEGLAKSITDNGIQTPLSIDHENRILSGARRWAGAKAAGLETVPCLVEEPPDVELYILIANQYRDKTPCQAKAEADAWYSRIKTGESTYDDLIAAAKDNKRLYELARIDDHVRLAAGAAGLGGSWYSGYRYLEDGGAERDIQEAQDDGELSETQAIELRESLEEEKAVVGRGASPQKTARKVREQIRVERARHEDPAWQKEREAWDHLKEVRSAGRKYQRLLRVLLTDHVDHLGGRSFGGYLAASDLSEHLREVYDLMTNFDKIVDDSRGLAAGDGAEFVECKVVTP